MKMTQNRRRKYGLLLVAWLLLWGGLLVPARAYREATPPQSWQRTPVMSEDVRPAYEFRSTSSYTATTGRGSAAPISAPYSSKPRRVNPLDDSVDPETGDPDGYGVGIFNTPVGEPMVLLV
ncbi:MAG: hypothetical protein II448_00640, partial [Paludibacteraceae bacterium]|nr:hypothetical protein [Paludibacteraceae bacterium]